MKIAARCLCIFRWRYDSLSRDKLA